MYKFKIMYFIKIYNNEERGDMSISFITVSKSYFGAELLLFCKKKERKKKKWGKTYQIKKNIHVLQYLYSSNQALVIIYLDRLEV